MKKKILTVMSSILLVLVSCKAQETETHLQQVKVVTGVKTSMPVVKTVTEFYETTGFVKARNTSIVSAKVMGTVDEIYVKEGEWVKKGDPLLRINSPEIEAKVRQAEEAVEEAKRAVEMAEKQKALAEVTHRRYEALYRENAISQQEFDQIKTKRDVATLQYEMALKSLQRAEAALQEAMAYRGYTVVTAPQDGRIAEKKIDIGTMAAPGMPLFVLEESHYQVVFSVDESLAGKIRTGKEIEVSVRAIGYTAKVKISEVTPQVDPMTRTFSVKALLPEIDGLRGGLYAEVKVPVGQIKRLLIPETALFQWGALEAVYVVDREKIVHLRLVKTGKADGQYVEVLSGLEPEEEIVVEGTEVLKDGVRVGRRP